MNVNIFNILIISGVIHGVIFSAIILFSKKYKSKSNMYLALVVLFLSLNNLYYWFIDTLLSLRIECYECYYVPFKLLVLPFFLYFTISFLDIKVKYKYLALVFAPFILFFSFKVISLFMEDFETSSYKIIDTPLYYFEEYFSAIYSISIILACYILIKNYDKKTQYYNSKKPSINTKWLKQLLFLGVFACLIWLMVVLYNQAHNFGLYANYNRYFLLLSTSFIVYWIGYLGVYHKGVFRQRVIIRKSIKVDYNLRKLSNSKITEIKRVIAEEKLFLNPRINLEVIAKEFDLNMNYLSSLFNENSEISFSSFLNSLRIEYSKKLLLNNNYSSYTVVSIGLESGFNSKSAFYTAFRKEVAMTPSEFRKINLS
ncbi:MAG: AraC family transcriptional regulator [Flavobacteriaceae bacterium]